MPAVKYYMSMMKTEYKIEIVRGHILVNDDRGSRVLIDTGSPLSFHSEGVIALGDETFNVPTSLMGIGSDYVTENVGADIDGLVGMDILGNGILIDVPHERIVLGHTTDGLTQVPSQSLFGYMAAEMDIRGRKAMVIIDTGAPTSYVMSSLTDGLSEIERVTDFNPMVPGGTFETPIFELPVSFAGLNFNMRAGHLPSLLRTTLSILGVDGVIGMELLQRQPLLIANGGVWV
jgi:hypothetical protein